MAACPVCGIDETAISVGDATDAIRTFPRRYREALEGAPADALVVRPAGEPASMLGYAELARQGLELLAGYLPAVLTGSEPAFPPSDLLDVTRPPAVVPDPGIDADATLAGIEAACARLVAQIVDVPLSAWDRPFTIGDGRHTAIWIPRRAAHEGAHHLRDIARVRRSVLG